MTQILHSLLFLLASVATVHAAEPVRIGAVAFGTMNWELAAMQNAGLDKSHGLELHIQTLTNAQAGQVALLAGGVDVAVSDWVWVSRQRENGADFTFVPYSTSHGVLLAPPGSSIAGVADLAGKRLGIAGGGLDKNWLLLRALAQSRYGLDLQQAATLVFGAPPLLNEQLQQGKLDVLLDYWHYAAKLESQGYRPLLTGQDLMRQLGVQASVPSLGYVFKESWAQQHRSALDGFLRAAGEAKRLLCESDAAWEKITPLTQENDPNALASLRQHYCAGQIRQWGDEERLAAAAIYRIIKQTGGAEAAGSADTPAPGTFWPYRLDQ